MLTRLQTRVPFRAENAALEVVATFGLVAYGATDDMITVSRSYKYGKAQAEIEVRWGSFGSRDLAFAHDFAAVLAEALAFAQQLRVGALDNDSLAARAEALEAERDRLISTD